MERKENKIKQRCRACLTEGFDMFALEDDVCLNENDRVNLKEALASCTSLEMAEDRNFPAEICRNCLEMLKICCLFRLKCEKSQRMLREELDRKYSYNLTNLDNSESDVENASSNIDPFYLPKEDLCLNKEASNHECLSCKVSFTTTKDPQPYIETHDIFACAECNKSFKTLSSLKKHKQVHSRQTQAKTLPVLSLDARTCDQCGKQFEYRAGMLKHKRRHGAPTKKCSYCFQVPETPSLLAKHMEEHHSNLKNIVCSLCKKTFFRQSNLRLHMAVHSGVKKHTCEICGISFALAGNLASHRRLHTGEKPYTCSRCGRGFAQQSSLRSHEAGHTNRRDFKCDECGAAFSRAGALRNHTKRHLPDRPFVCSMCGKAFAFSAERKRHMTVHTGDKNHVCDICGRRFNRGTNLKVHKRIHTGETPHVCAICGKGFVQARCLKTHMGTHGK